MYNVIGKMDLKRIILKLTRLYVWWIVFVLCVHDKNVECDSVDVDFSSETILKKDFDIDLNSMVVYTMVEENVSLWYSVYRFHLFDLTSRVSKYRKKRKY